MPEEYTFFSDTVEINSKDFYLFYNSLFLALDPRQKRIVATYSPKMDVCKNKITIELNVNEKISEFLFNHIIKPIYIEINKLSMFKIEYVGFTDIRLVRLHKLYTSVGYVDGVEKIEAEIQKIAEDKKVAESKKLHGIKKQTTGKGQKKPELVGIKKTTASKNKKISGGKDQKKNKIDRLKKTKSILAKNKGKK